MCIRDSYRILSANISPSFSKVMNFYQFQYHLKNYDFVSWTLLEHPIYQQIMIIHNDLTNTFIFYFLNHWSIVCLFALLGCLSRIFHSHCCEGQQILSYARHSWQLSSEGPFACHTYCDTRHPLIMIEDPWHPHQLPSV